MKDVLEDGKPMDFSLVLGGPLYQLFLRARMAQPPLDLLRRRLVGIPLFAWAPLLLLSALEGQAFGGVRVPFLWDIEAHARFLVALPLLIAAEVIVHQRLGPAVRQFLERGIVRKEGRPRLEAAIASTLRLRNSVLAELFLLAFVLTVGHYLWRERLALQETWYARRTGSGPSLSLAGQWYVWISLPLFQFILLRWFYRLLLWCRFLWGVSRLDLHLMPTHPDRAAGLGFLGVSTQAFAPLLVGQTAVVSGLIASRILHEGARVTDFRMEIVGSVTLALVLVLGPLVVFLPKLLAAKREGLREYGLLANRYVRDFDAKWVRGGAKGGEPLLGSGDIQSLADLANSFEVVRSMRVLPFGKETVLQLGVPAALPLLPLALTMFPLEELFRRLLVILL